MSAAETPVVDRPATEPPQDATDTLRALYGGVLPCSWCDRCGPCPCVLDPIGVHRARVQVTKRHRAAVTRARVSRRPARRAA